MTVKDIVDKALRVAVIEAIGVYTSDGKLVYSSEKWPANADVKPGLNAWNTDTDEFMLAGDKYLVLRKDEDILAATSTAKGPLLLAKSKTGKYVIFAKLKPGAEMGEIGMEISDLAYALEA
ncbi:MAG: hypothetical protein QXL15_00075 [Candidatus Korarchaeota archaeon]